MRDLNSDLKAWKEFQFQFFLSTSWWLEALKIAEKIIREKAFEHNKKKTRVKFNPGLNANRLSNNWAQVFSPKSETYIYNDQQLTGKLLW